VSAVHANPVFVALADPTRRAILRTLADGSSQTASSLATDYPITRQAIAKHLAILEQVGLVSVTPHGRERRYQLSPEPLAAVSDWVQELASRWDERLLRLKALAERDEG
jgi:DNA-binding transcriptional ArsR family regulator